MLYELLQYWQSLPSTHQSCGGCSQPQGGLRSTATWRPDMKRHHCSCPCPVAECASLAVQGNLVTRQEGANPRQEAGDSQTQHQQGAAAQPPPAAQQAWPAEVSGVQAPVSAHGRPGGGPQAPQAALWGAAQPHAAGRPQTAPLSSQRPLSRAAAQAGSQTHQPAAAVKQQKESMLDDMDLQNLGCNGWLGIKDVLGSRPATAAAGVGRQGGSAAQPNSARRRPRPASAGAQCRSGGSRVTYSPRLSARQGVGPDQHWQASSAVRYFCCRSWQRQQYHTVSQRGLLTDTGAALEPCSAVVCHPISQAHV